MCLRQVLCLPLALALLFSTGLCLRIHKITILEDYSPSELRVENQQLMVEKESSSELTEL